MNGTGTKESPYIVKTADDLYSMGNSGGSEIYFSLGSDIDFNNTPYAENFQPIPINCKMFSGNGHTIRNINYSTPESNASIFTVSCENAVIDSLKTENIRLAGKSVFLFSHSGEECNISLKHCVFVINDVLILSPPTASATNRYCLMHDHNTKISADYCTFAVKMQSEKAYPFFACDSISHSQTKAETRINSFANSGNIYASFLSNSVISDSYFFLRIKTPENDSSGAFDFASNDNKFNSSYLICKPSGALNVVRWYGDIGSTCFYDKTLVEINNTYISLITGTMNIHALTTEQCKNPMYLRSIGFNCAGAEE